MTQGIKLVLCDNLEGWGGREVGEEFRKEGSHVCLWLIPVDVWQKPSQYCKVIIHQLKLRKKKILSQFSLPEMLPRVFWAVFSLATENQT